MHHRVLSRALTVGAFALIVGSCVPADPSSQGTNVGGFGLLDIIWLIFIISSLQPLIQQRVLMAQRVRSIRSLERRRNSRVITLIHRQEGLALFGIPFARYIDIDDSEQILRAIELTDEDLGIDIILHTPGGLVLAAEQIAHALQAHPGKVTAFVPHYAMSGGTLIALAADEIVMSPSAVLGPVDPQLGQYAARSIVEAVEAKTDVNRVDDETLILSDLSRKALRQVKAFVENLLTPKMDTDQAARLADTLSQGHWTHDYPLLAKEAQELGLPVSTDLPNEVRDIMRLYPQPRGRRPSVEYIPMPYRSPEDGQRRPSRDRHSSP